MKSGNINTRHPEKYIIVPPHVFQIKLFIIQDCSIALINGLERDDNLVVKE